jgi:Protein kinase domain
MDDQRWRLTSEVFHAAIGRAAEERHAFLEEACRGDEVLRRNVQRLVQAHERAGAFLDAAAVSNAIRVVAAGGQSSAVGPQFSAYRAGREFQGTARFIVLRCLGAGGMGIVYQAYDQVRDEIVALKTLLRAGAADLYRLKREFRSLADVAHRNLVCLHELIVEDEHCFFTMELVNGVNLVEYVRGPATDTASSREQTLLTIEEDGVMRGSSGRRMNRPSDRAQYWTLPRAAPMLRFNRNLGWSSASCPCFANSSMASRNYTGTASFIGTSSRRMSW